MKGHVMNVTMKDGSKTEVPHVYPKLCEGLVLHTESDAYPELKHMMDNGYGEHEMNVKTHTHHLERMTVRKLYQRLWSKRYEYVVLT